MEEDNYEETDLDLSDANVVTKFRTASDIANRNDSDSQNEFISF
jgi:hypothetical protein